MKLLVAFEPNESNLALMSRRHRNENPMGWDSGFYTPWTTLIIEQISLDLPGSKLPFWQMIPGLC